MLLVISLIVSPSNADGQSVDNTFPTELLPEYAISEPVRITSNEDFIKQNYTGSGTQSDPYRIQSLNISNTPISIQISDTTAWFVISNCYLRSNTTSGAAVYLNNVTNGRVQDSIVGGEMIGIYLESSRGCIIRRNIVHGFVVGILFQNSIDSIIRDNLVHSCEVGIRINDSFDCRIHDNRVYANTNAGIVLTRLSQGNSVFDNYIAYNIVGSQADENNAKDDGLLNSWERNNWSDYLINQTYSIPGLAGTIDEFAGGLVFWSAQYRRIIEPRLHSWVSWSHSKMEHISFISSVI